MVDFAYLRRGPGILRWNGLYRGTNRHEVTFLITFFFWYLGSNLNSNHFASDSHYEPRRSRTAVTQSLCNIRHFATTMNIHGVEQIPDLFEQFDGSNSVSINISRRLHPSQVCRALSSSGVKGIRNELPVIWKVDNCRVFRRGNFPIAFLVETRQTSFMEHPPHSGIIYLVDLTDLELRHDMDSPHLTTLISLPVLYNTAGLMSILQGDMVVRCEFGDTLRLE